MGGQPDRHRRGGVRDYSLCLPQKTGFFFLLGSALTPDCYILAVKKLRISGWGVSYPTTNQAWPSLASKIRQDVASYIFFNTVFYSVSLSFGVSHKWLWTVVFGTSTTAPLFHLQGFQLSHLICFVVLLALLRSATVITFTKSVM